MKVKRLVIPFISGLALSALFAASTMAAEESDPTKEQFYTGADL